MSVPNLFVVRAWGDLRLEEIRQVLNQVRPHVSQSSSMLADGILATRTLSPSELAVIANDLRALADLGLKRLAIVAGDDEQVDPSRGLVSLAANIRVQGKPVPGMDAAREWPSGARR